MATSCPLTTDTDPYEPSGFLMSISYKFLIKDSLGERAVVTVETEGGLNLAKQMAVWKVFYEYKGCKPFDPEEFENFLDPKMSHVPDSYGGGPMYECAHEILYNKLGYIPQYQQGKKEQQ
jgi:hypothetical protein